MTAREFAEMILTLPEEWQNRPLVYGHIGDWIAVDDVASLIIEEAEVRRFLMLLGDPIEGAP
jgi:hypothetical protein